MKIIYHHRTLGDGAEGIHITEMVNAFRELGHTVRLAGPVPEKKGVAEPPPWVSSLKKIFRGPVYECLELGYNLAGFISLAKEICRFRPDFIYDRYITYNAAPVLAGRVFHIPVILEVNAPLAYERAFESDEKLYFKRLALVFEKWISRSAHKTMVVSSPLKSYLRSLGVPGDQISVIPNGVNTKKFYPMNKPRALMRKLEISETNIVVGFTGILRPWHGIDLLLDAFALLHKECPQALLLLVGDGSIRHSLEQKADELGCPKAVRITGRVPHKTVRDHISLFDIAVSPKTTFYASPMKIPEYMAMGKPVIAPDTQNIHDLIQDQKTGLLFESENSNDLARALKQLAMDESGRKDLGKAGISEIKHRLNWPYIAKFIIDSNFRDKKQQ